MNRQCLMKLVLLNDSTNTDLDHLIPIKRSRLLLDHVSNKVPDGI